MKKLLLMLSAFALSSGLALAQCTNSGVQFGSGTAPGPGASLTVTTCAYAGEYQTISGVLAGNSFTVTMTGGASNFVTIYDATFTPIFWGASPVSFTAPSAGTYYSQVNLTGCGTDFSCHTVVWANTTPPPPCPGVITPWLDNVETHTATTTLGTSNCWTTTSPTVFDWNVTGTGTTPSAGTGANAANSGTRYFYTEASGAAIGAEAILVTPDIDLSGVTVPMLSFYYHMFGAQTGTLFVEISNNGGTSWNPVTSLVGAQQTAQAEAFLLSETTLTGYTGTVKIRFRAVSNGSFEGDICIDDIAVVQAPTCPAPTGLTLTGADLTSATFSWNPGNAETAWALEYGAPGFTPGTGTSTLVTNNVNEVVSGLTPNQFYSMYVRAVCSPGDTSTYVGPVSFNTYNQGLYMDVTNECGPGFTDITGTGVLNLLGDDGEVGVTMPFTILYQGVPYNNMTIGSNGALVFGTTTAQVGFTNGAMAGQVNGLYPWWDDLYVENSPTDGVYYQTLGTAPNQQFIVQWNKPHISGNGLPYIFQTIIDEATNEIYFIYDDVEVGDFNDFASSATIGVAGPNQDIELSFNNTQYLTNNSCAHFFYTDCPNPTAFTVGSVTPTTAGISWTAGLASETNWTIIYGPAGFDPLVSGTMISATTNGALLTGLSDITTYDVYIYADCNLTTQSIGGLFGSFTTPPNCSDIVGLNAATEIDSLLTSWSWTESSGVGTYASTGFNVQYGPLGFDLYTGTIVNADNNNSDTTFNAGFMAGGVYEVYVQAVCGVDTSNYVGPVVFTMPLTNDLPCFAQELPVDGTSYAFNNAGATVDATENTIAPPSTGYNEVDGWGVSTINFTTWFTFVAPPSGSLYISGKEVGFDGQIALYEVTDCGLYTSYTLLAANDDATDFTSVAPYFSWCGLTPGNTYYLMHDSWSTTTTGVYSIALSAISLEAGTDNGMSTICLGDIVDLSTQISGEQPGGVWTGITTIAGITDSLFNSAGLANQVFEFQYTVTEECAMDSVLTSVEIIYPSSAGNDGVVTVCLNEPVNLLSGLSGNVDLGGTWYDPTNTALPSPAIVAGAFPGQYNYDYITGNGVCPDDTANVILNVNGSCDYLNLQEVEFAEMEIYPNPTTETFYISNAGSSEVFNYELTDLNGKVIASRTAVINGSETTEVSLKLFETGVYLIRIFNENAEQTFRVVKQ